MNILKTKISYADPTIYKIRNYDRIRIITENNTGEVKKIELTDECDPGTKEGIRMLRTALREVKERENLQLVDVGFPTSILKVGFSLLR